MDWKYVFDKRRVVEEKYTVNSFHRNIRSLVGDFICVEFNSTKNLIQFCNSEYEVNNLKTHCSIEKEIWANIIITECICPIAQLYRFERIV